MSSTEIPLRDALQTDEPRRNDLVVSNSVLTSCICIDEKGHSWVFPYHRISPCRFLESRFELYFGDHVVLVGIKETDQVPIESMLQALAEWRLSLLAHGDWFSIKVARLE
jgi:hypothetical protein